ncbi:DUF4468 domain-containing protein [Mucilaginibacter limnophilus]|uniref:DUF4468 domain-containing protein n=1 Tax=Mucilaginibacter limnophilus TaxID=1932778 RepID=A0A3S2UPN9_9SPHI|nr:DUF4468 domain-containing protein [Mucilaginibacter limnophilus]RVU02960.1 DUF4468 domain-containing protein [Mucilaginibacter limnophilus]
MNKIVLLILVVSAFSITSVHAQNKDSLSFDERNKYIYYQVAEETKVKADTLYERALHFLKNAFENDRLKLSKEDKDKAILTGKGGFMVTKKALVSMQDDAKITFNMVIEVKDGKYRYWFTDFAAIPYRRDRYANFSPVDGKKIPLEQGLRKLGQKTLDDYLEQTLINCRNISGVLKTYMQKPSGTPKNDGIKRSVTTKEW